MRFLVFSDLHLDRDVEDVGPDRGARRRADLRARLDRVLALAEEHEVDAILSAGDLYEARHLLPGTASFLVDRLGRAGRPVFLAPGDEDPHTPDSLYATTAWPANVHVFDHDLLVPVELADGVRLWGAAHLRHGDTAGFLDGFRIIDDGVNLALFHGSEVGAASRDTAPVVAPFRADQVERTGLTHAFVGHAHVPVDAPRHTVPGPLAPLAPLDPDEPEAGASGLPGVVIVDVAPDGSVHRQRVDVTTPTVHEVTIDLTDAASTDEVLERMIASVEDLEGTVRVRLHGQPDPDVIVLDEDLTSWSTDSLEIVLDRRTTTRPPHRQVERPAPAPRRVERHAPPADAVREAAAAHDAWQEALAALHDHVAEEPAPVEHRDLGGLDLDTIATHLQTLRARPAGLEMDRPATMVVARPEAPPAPRGSRWRAVGRAVAALVTLSAAAGLLLRADTTLEQVVPVVAIVLVAVILVVTRRGVVEDPELEAERVRAEVRATLLRRMEPGAELAHAQHLASTALREAGLPTDPDELAALVDRARFRAPAGREHRTVPRTQPTVPA